MKLRYGIKRTVNLGNYESISIDYSAEVDCFDENGVLDVNKKAALMEEVETTLQNKLVELESVTKS